VRIYAALSTQWATSTDQNITASKWNHIAYSVNGTIVKLYINGSLSQTITGSAVMPNTATIVAIGRAAGGRGLNGYVSQFQFYYSVLHLFSFKTPTEWAELSE